MNLYKVYKAGNSYCCSIAAPCITKAAQKLLERLPPNATYEIHSTEHATVRLAGNHNVMSDYVINSR